MRVAVAALALLLWTPIGAGAQSTPALKCGSSKLKAVGSHADGELKCHAKAVKKNEAVDAACLARADSRHGDKFAKAEAKGGCDTTDDADELATSTHSFVGDVVAAIPTGATPESRACASTKLKATGKEAKSLLTCHAKAASRNEPLDPACESKARAKFDQTFAKADAKGGCASVGDENTIEPFVDQHTHDSVAQLVAICGDDIAGPGEACDGADDAACPGECIPSCVCAGNCGDGVLEEPGEECDDGNIADGDGCSSTCQLEDPSAACEGVPATPGTALGVELVTSALDNPVALAAPPLDPRRIFVVEQAGIIRVVRDGVLLPGEFLDISGPVLDGGERGLLGLAFHPDYENNGFFFVDYTRSDGDLVISRFEALTDDTADDTSEEVLLVIDDFASNHNGGQLAFGADGYLYAGMGDGGGGGDPNETGQDDGEVLGKMLRIDVDVASPPFWDVPPDNPNPGAPGQLALVWAKGLRNPWRFSFDRGTDDLYIADVGQGSIEEIDYTPAPRTGGENYGWDIFEGSECFEPAPDPDCPDPPTGFDFPVHEYDHSEGCSVTGGYVYRGCAMPDVSGTYFYSDYCSGWIRTFEVVGGVALNHADVTTELEGEGLVTGNTSTFGEDARGEVYIVTHGGSVWKIVPGT